MSFASPLYRRIGRALARLGLRPAIPRDLEAGRDLAVRLIGPQITSLQRLRAVQRRSGIGAFVIGEPDTLEGIFVFLLLNPAGRAALCGDDFDGLSPDLALLAAPSEAPSAYYGWGFAATTPRARAAVVAGADVLRRRVLCDIPFFCRAVTPAGHRVVTSKLGYRDLPGSNTGLLWAPALTEDSRRAA